jgi:putative sterol carrier protein
VAVEFGTVKVYEEMANLLNNDPEWAEKGKAITYTMIYDYGAPVSKAFFVKFEEGKITEVRELPSAEGESADFVISGAPEVWRGVLDKSINPTAAMTRGQLKVKGKMTTLLKHMGAFGYIIDSMTKIELT